MDIAATISLLAAVVAAVASVVAARAALATIVQTRELRREDQIRRLSEALIRVMTAAENYPRESLGAAAGRNQAFDDAVEQLELAASMTILGLSDQIGELLAKLWEKDAWRHPKHRPGQRAHRL